MTTRLELLPDVYLTAVQTSRFKTACFSLSFLRPLRQEEAGMNALLPSVLLRGSESAPSIRAIADRLDALCGASVGSLVRKKGEIQLTGLFEAGSVQGSAVQRLRHDRGEASFYFRLS